MVPVPKCLQSKQNQHDILLDLTSQFQQSLCITFHAGISDCADAYLNVHANTKFWLFISEINYMIGMRTTEAWEMVGYRVAIYSLTYLIYRVLCVCVYIYTPTYPHDLKHWISFSISIFVSMKPILSFFRIYVWLVYIFFYSFQYHLFCKAIAINKLKSSKKATFIKI